MTITSQTFNVHQFGEKGYTALCEVERILGDLQEHYEESDGLMSPNDGEIIVIEELARVKGILSFLVTNRVVEVNPK